jgi:hypothetical protein
MIDMQTSEQAIEALVTAIAAIIEDVHEDAVVPATTLAGYAEIAEVLGQAGADVAALASALAVLVKRSEAWP